MERPNGIENNYASPRWSGELLDCSLPMSFDQHSRCSYDCLYCFSYFQKSISQFSKAAQTNTALAVPYTQRPPSSVNVQNIIDMFTGKRKTVFASLISRKNPFQWGGLADPFDNFEKKYGTGLQILEVLHKMKFPICFSTKGTWIVDDDRYARLFHKNDFWNVKVSIINMNAEQAKLMERGVPSPQERLEFIKRMVKIQGPGGGGVTLRLRPFIIGYTNVDNGHVKLIELAGKAGATAVSTEFMCVESRCAPDVKERYDLMDKATGFDLLDFYKKNTVVPTGYLRLNWQIKEPFVNDMERAAKKAGMRFYVSDAHHKDRSCNGSCCGLPENWKYHRGQFTEALCIAKKKGWVGWNDIEKNIFPEYKVEKIVQGCGINIGRNTVGARAKFKMLSIYDYIRYVWNSPQQSRSPYKYFYGLLTPEKKDANGNLIYKYNPYSKGIK